MSQKSKIEWTDVTWNPIRGCSRISPGCLNCYAERQAIRQAGPGRAYEGLVQITNGHPQWTGKVFFDEKRLFEPLTWRTPRRVFVNSMSDLFHESVPDQTIDKIFAVMALCPQHTFQVLTKRTTRVWDYFFLINRSYREAMIGQEAMNIHLARGGDPPLEWSGLPLPNVLHGFSAENQEYFDKRWNAMGRLAAAGFKTMVSCEPLLGPIDMGTGRLPDWVIAGGESGPGARPMHPDWARSLRDQCQRAGKAFFFKQHGAWISLADYDFFKHGADTKKYKHQFAWQAGAENKNELPISCYQVGKRAAGAELDGREWKEYPEVADGRPVQS